MQPLKIMWYVFILSNIEVYERKVMYKKVNLWNLSLDIYVSKLKDMLTIIIPTVWTLVCIILIFYDSYYE
jgi:hypothetical protein